ncbi:ABC transporter ATP-binding protein [Acidisoma cellulosilytica]|uniref:ABC transporter ATP-binding protein n=1 Tax=Acidisoma cellulosilyticum TaxID=2802395 RepID=A0A963Z4Z5_9PROT|nr:ABC transporter ATP-binding protein [Acidisoma cellulosilyticum]MCB8882868.1 ABC transporter ATP-binding protein [Acidisoma cellulosilyticum]
MAMDLRIEHLTCGYRRRAVIRDLTVAPLRQGRVVGLLGPNAAGKSTLLKGLAGLLPAQGRAMLGETDLIGLPPRQRAKLLGFMPQAIPDGVELTVFESLIASLQATGAVPGAQAAERAAAALSRIDILPLAMRKLSDLSGGQKQLVSFAQAVAGNPALLCLDEPTSALDPRHQLTVMARARQLAADGALVIVVLHDLALAARWADEILILKDGTLYAQGAPDVVITRQMLAEVYGVDGHAERNTAGHLTVHLNAAVL